MNYRHLLITCLLGFTSIQATAENHEMKLGMYVVVSELDVSKVFYSKLFRTDPYFENEAFVGFSISGGLFGIFTESAFTHELVRGNNSVPYIQVEDIQAEFARMKTLSGEMVHDKIVVEGPIQLFMFKDPDGNSIEFFSLPTVSSP